MRFFLSIRQKNRPAASNSQRIMGSRTATMGEIQKEERQGDDAALASGMEVNLGDFTRTVGLMKSLRLMLNNQMVVNVEDLASSVNDAGRKFKLGDIEQANIDVARSYAAFGQRTNQ